MSTMARRRFRKALSGARAPAACAGGGALMAAADQYIYTNDTISNIVGDGGILKPLVNGVVGWLVAKKMPNVGAGIIGVAGYQAAHSLLGSPLETSGLYEADAGALRMRGRRGAAPFGMYGAQTYNPQAYNPQLAQQYRAQQTYDAGAVFDPAYAE